MSKKVFTFYRENNPSLEPDNGGSGYVPTKITDYILLEMRKLPDYFNEEVTIIVEVLR